MIKQLLFLLVVLFITFLVSCNNEREAERFKKIEIDTDFTVTYSSGASQKTRNSAKKIKNAYEALGITLAISEEGDNEAVDVPAYEILVGESNRTESRTLMDSLDRSNTWRIAVIGKKLVIVGKSDSDIVTAVRIFISEYIEKGEGRILMEGFLLSGSAPVSEPIEFLWKDGTESLIKSSAWAPRVYTMSNGELIAGYETSSGIKTMISSNHADDWEMEVQASFRPDLICANVNFFEADGKVYLAYRAIRTVTNGFYTSLQMSVSEDFGRTWRAHSTVAENLEKSGKQRGVWEPYLGILEGRLCCFYANDSLSVTLMQNIEYKLWNGHEWTDRTIVSKGMSHNSRDGMPVWMQLSTGEYVCVIESSKYRNQGYPFVLQILISEDGKTWSEPVDIYKASTKRSKAAAPGIVELTTGQLVISFQTDEDATEKGDAQSVMKTILSDGTPIEDIDINCFSSSESVFEAPDGEASVWTGLWYADGWLYATAGTSKGASLKRIALSCT